MEAVPFISLVIVAVTQMIKMASPKVLGWVTILVALVVAVVIALVDTVIGVTDISVAGAIMAWFGAVGLSSLAGKAGGGTAGDGTSTHLSR